MRNRLLITGLLLAAVQASAADLPTPNALQDLIADSHAIVQAKPVQVSLDEAPVARRGYAVLRVYRVLKGSFPGETVTIQWNELGRDQRIPSVEGDWLLAREQKVLEVVTSKE